MSTKPDFKTLQAKWYAKLKKSGFEDIEYANDYLKSSTSRFVAENPNPESWIATEQYYRLAAHFLHDYKFESKRDAVIWEYHANGISVRDISVLLKKARQKRRISSSEVSKDIGRLRDEMKLMYLPSLDKTNAN